MLLEVKRVAYITVYYHPAVTTLNIQSDWNRGGGCPNYRVYPWWCPFLRAAFDSIIYQYWLLYTTPFCCYGRIKTFVLPMSSLVARQCHYEHCQFGNVADGVTKDGFLMMRLFCWLDLFNCELIVHYSIWTVTVIGSTFSHDEHSSTKINISHFIRARFLSYDPLSLLFFPFSLQHFKLLFEEPYHHIMLLIYMISLWFLSMLFRSPEM